MNESTFWMVTSFVLLFAIGGLTYSIISYQKPILSENQLDCMNRGGEYTLRINPERAVEWEDCEIKQSIKYN
jgi:hypothetical protein